MNNGFIAVFDSGIGGISVLNELIRLMPNERYIYFGDNKNAPYGNRTEYELLTMALRNVEYVKSLGAKLVVIGCNTLSVTVLDKIRYYADIPVFAVFPPVEKALLENGKILLLATTRTAEKYKGVEGVCAVGLRTLARDIEHNALNLSRVDVNSALNQTEDKFIDEIGYYDTVILGCTHYFFVKNKIFDHFRPQKISSGELFTASIVKKYLQCNKSLVNNKGFELLFVGDNSQFNKEFFSKSGQNILKF